MPKCKYNAKVYKNCYEDDTVFIMHLDRFSKIAAQYFYRLHQKRSKNLGVYNFDLSLEILPGGKLKILQSDFRKLENLFLRSILDDPDSIYELINRRKSLLKQLQEELFKEEKILHEEDYHECNPLKIFEISTDFSSFYLEYYFPFDFFENLLIKKLNYTPFESEEIILNLMTPQYSTYLEYYKFVLGMALDMMCNGKINIEKFRRNYGFLGNQDLKEDRLKTDDEILKYIKEVSENKSVPSIIAELQELEKKKQLVSISHLKIKTELHQRALRYGESPKLVIGLADLLIDTGLENEENHYWRNRIFAYFRDLAKRANLDYRSITIEELNEKIKKTQ